MAEWNAKELKMSCQKHVTEIARLLAHFDESKEWFALSIVIVEIDKLHLSMNN